MIRYIIFCGYAGLKGSLKIIESRYSELGRYFNKIYLKSVVSHIQDRGYYGRYLSPINNDRPDREPVNISDIFAGFSDDIAEVGEGGILKSVYELAKLKRCGFEIEIKKISTIQICIEVCEYFGINIYRLLSEGKLITAEDPIYTCKLLENRGIATSIIGHLSDGLDKLIVDKEVIEYVNRPTQDEIFKVIKYEREDIIGN